MIKVRVHSSSSFILGKQCIYYEKCCADIYNTKQKYLLLKNKSAPNHQNKHIKNNFILE